MGVHLMGMRLISMHLVGVHVMGVHLINLSYTYIVEFLNRKVTATSEVSARSVAPQSRQRRFSVFSATVTPSVSSQARTPACVMALKQASLDFRAPGQW